MVHSSGLVRVIVAITFLAACMCTTAAATDLPLSVFPEIVCPNPSAADTTVRAVFAYSAARDVLLLTGNMELNQTADQSNGAVYTEPNATVTYTIRQYLSTTFLPADLDVASDEIVSPALTQGGVRGMDLSGWGLWVLQGLIAVDNTTYTSPVNCTFFIRGLPGVTLEPAGGRIASGTEVLPIYTNPLIVASLPCTIISAVNDVANAPLNASYPMTDTLLVEGLPGATIMVNVFLRCSIPVALLNDTSVSNPPTTVVSSATLLTYTIIGAASAPTFTPDPRDTDMFSETVDVRMATTTPNSTIYFYVLDTTKPVDVSPSLSLFTKGSIVTLSRDATVLAIATSWGSHNSPISRGVFRINEGVAYWKYVLCGVILGLAFLINGIIQVVMALNPKKKFTTFEMMHYLGWCISDLLGLSTDIAFGAYCLAAEGVEDYLRIIYAILGLVGFLLLLQRAAWANNRYTDDACFYRQFIPCLNTFEPCRSDVKIIHKTRPKRELCSGCQRIFHDVPTLVVALYFSVTFPYYAQDASLIKIFASLTNIAMGFVGFCRAIIYGAQYFKRRCIDGEESDDDDTDSDRRTLERGGRGSATVTENGDTEPTAAERMEAGESADGRTRTFETEDGEPMRIRVTDPYANSSPRNMEKGAAAPPTQSMGQPVRPVPRTVAQDSNPIPLALSDPYAIDPMMKQQSPRGADFDDESDDETQEGLWNDVMLVSEIKLLRRIRTDLKQRNNTDASVAMLMKQLAELRDEKEVAAGYHDPDESVIPEEYIPAAPLGTKAGSDFRLPAAEADSQRLDNQSNQSSVVRTSTNGVRVVLHDAPRQSPKRGASPARGAGGGEVSTTYTREPSPVRRRNTATFPSGVSGQPEQQSAEASGAPPQDAPATQSAEAAAPRSPVEPATPQLTHGTASLNNSVQAPSGGAPTATPPVTPTSQPLTPAQRPLGVQHPSGQQQRQSIHQHHHHQHHHHGHHHAHHHQQQHQQRRPTNLSNPTTPAGQRQSMVHHQHHRHHQHHGHHQQHQEAMNQSQRLPPGGGQFNAQRRQSAAAPQPMAPTDVANPNVSTSSLEANRPPPLQTPTTTTSVGSAAPASTTTNSGSPMVRQNTVAAAAAPGSPAARRNTTTAAASPSPGLINRL